MIKRCLEHKQIPPHPLATEPNPAIPFTELNLRLPEALMPWPETSGPARAAVNSFGFGGTNGHALLQEAPRRDADGAPAPPNAGESRAHLLALSARSEPALLALARSYLDRPILGADGEASPVSDLCYSAGARSSHHPYRLALVIDSLDALREKLRAFAAATPAAGTVRGFARPHAAPRIRLLGYGTTVVMDVSCCATSRYFARRSSGSTASSAAMPAGPSSTRVFGRASGTRESH